ncbi:MAG: TIGR02206 family membrane protein [Saprospiraceae bacterium]|nr:TIGR02206 family membrane protein [Saprospiraceae bacterium]MCB9345685.1 TIGR02206 family membrane protein [Lewinellaceae bacterium]
MEPQTAPELSFVWYEMEHWLWLIAGATSTFLWIRIGKAQRNDQKQQQLGLIMSLIPAILWIGIALYMVFYDDPFDIGLVLPFHVCYFLNLLMPFMLWRRSYFLFEISYFMVMGGCIQALITPDILTTFPDYINIRYFVVHICLVQSVLYAIFVFGFRPTWKSFGKSLLWTNIYLLFVICLNALLGTNFMYLKEKPTTTTMLDLFGEWPWYIIGGEFLAFAIFSLLMLPFMFSRKKESG